LVLEMNPEKAHSVAVHIDQLSGIGRALRDSSTSSDSYKITAWLGEIVSVFKNDFENNPAMLKEAEGLIKESSIKEGSIKEAKKPPIVINKALSLLNTAKELIFIDPQSTASETLKTLIDQTILENYFKRWEWKLLFGLYAAVAVLFAGGTLYLGFQVTGVANQADVARREIATAQDAVLAARREAVDLIGEKAKAEANEQIEKLQKAIDKSKDSIVSLDSQIKENTKKLDLQLSEGQAATKAVVDKVTIGLNDQSKQDQDKLYRQADEGRARITAAVDGGLRGIETTAKNEASGHLEKLRGAIELSTTSITNLNAQISGQQKTLADQLKEGQAKIKEVIDSSVAQGPAGVNSYLDAKRPTLDGAIAKAVNERVADANGQIQVMIDSVILKKKNFDDSLPDKTMYAINRVNEFNEIVNRYSVRINDILLKFSGPDRSSPIGTVAGVLGFSFWLVLGAVVMSALALIASVVALIRRRRA
jgi:hypothetical protein